MPQHPEQHALVFRATVDPANVDALLDVRPRAIAQARQAQPGLLRADLVRLDETTWLDILVFDTADGDERLMAAAGDLTDLHAMHALIGDVTALDRGQVAHSTHPLGDPATTAPPSTTAAAATATAR